MARELIARRATDDDGGDLVVVAVVKDGPPPECYLMIAEAANLWPLTRILGRWAGRDDLSFTWPDAEDCLSRAMQAAGIVAERTEDRGQRTDPT